MRPQVRAPEPAFFWLRYAPRRWPVPDRPWIDLARGGLGARPGDRRAGDPDAPLPGFEGAPFDDTLWLPPVPPAREAERRALARRHLQHGTPVLLQLHPGDEPVPEGATALFDLSEHLVNGLAWSRLPELAPGAVAVWPLISGVSDGPEAWREGCAALAAAGAGVVQGTVPALAPADRRRLADGLGEDAYHRLFHAGEGGAAAGVDEAAFARTAAVAGLAAFLPRPLPAPPATGRTARQIAGSLFLVAELWLRLDRPPSQGQAFFRAARWVDESSYDPEALAREGNLGVVEVLDAASRELIEDAVARGGRPALLDELLAEYTGAGAGGAAST